MLIRVLMGMEKENIHSKKDKPKEHLSDSKSATFQFADHRPESVAQRQLKNMINQSPQVLQQKANQEFVNQAITPLQQKTNQTGLPNQLKSGIEQLSGLSMDDVKVHYNSDKPAQLQAHAYAQGTDIHISSGQEKHLPHEAWHVVQQKQGRVKPTLQMKGMVNINDDAGLEKEADIMGDKAMRTKSFKEPNTLQQKKHSSPVVQREDDDGSKESSTDLGLVRGEMDLATNTAGIASDVLKGKSMTEVGGRVIKTAGSVAKVAAKTLVSSDNSKATSLLGVNLKTTGSDISEAGRVFSDTKSTSSDKAVAGTKAFVSVTGTASEALHSFGIAGPVPTAIATFMSDVIKALTATKGVYQTAHKIWNEITSENRSKNVMSGIASISQQLSNTSLSILRALASWQRANSLSDESYFLKLMPLGKSLANLSAAVEKGIDVYSDYQNYYKLTEAANKKKRKATSKDNLLLLAKGVSDKFYKDFTDTIIGIGETIYWAGKYFPMLSGISLIAGVSSKGLKLASTIFTSFNLRQTIRDSIPASIIGHEWHTAGLNSRRTSLINYVEAVLGNSNDAGPTASAIRESLGLKPGDEKNKSKIDKAIQKLI